MAVRFDPVADPPADPRRCQPGLVQLQQFYEVRFGAQNLGCYNYRRTRSGSGWSLHAEGRAVDGRCPDRLSLDRLFGWTVRNADVLNVQAMHDYERQLRWLTGVGWRSASIGAGAGGPTYHVERNWDGAKDPRPVLEIVQPPLPEDEDEMPKQLVRNPNGSVGVVGGGTVPNATVLAELQAKRLVVPTDQIVNVSADAYKVLVGV